MSLNTRWVEIVSDPVQQESSKILEKLKLGKERIKTSKISETLGKFLICEQKRGIFK
jgi:hypothetical protein